MWFVQTHRRFNISTFYLLFGNRKRVNHHFFLLMLHITHKRRQGCSYKKKRNIFSVLWKGHVLRQWIKKKESQITHKWNILHQFVCMFGCMFDKCVGLWTKNVCGAGFIWVHVNKLVEKRVLFLYFCVVFLPNYFFLLWRTKK